MFFSQSSFIIYFKNYIYILTIFMIMFFIDYFTTLFASLKHGLLVFMFPILELFSGYLGFGINERLKFENLEKNYEMLKSDYFRLQMEVESLRDILKSPAPENSYVTIAQVIGSHMNPTKMNITLNKGSSDGLKIGQVVISSKGLVGKIKDVWGKYSLVETILDKSLKIPAQLYKTKEKGLITHYRDGFLAFKYLNQIPKIGELVYTTHFDELYPENLIIGEVFQFENNIPLVKPYVDVLSLNYVMILK